MKLDSQYFEIGCRIPKDYFWVIGWGESDVGIETGSYDAALTMAGIENFNVMLYTSVLACCGAFGRSQRIVSGCAVTRPNRESVRNGHIADSYDHIWLK
jgi:hypothetical protein